MQLGRYEILQRLAIGPVAEVLLARATGLEGFSHHVVVKQLRPELAADERFRRAFLAEARIGASLHHQNIVQVHDIDADAGAFFAMEYVHGEDLRKLLLKVREVDAQMPLDQVVAIGAAVAAGLHHAHEQVGPDRKPLGLVHRDVTPSNIMVGYDGSVKLADFGLAKPALDAIMTRSGAMHAKAPYMSPEQCTGARLDRRSDVFALGIVLYELATARRLFKGDNDYQTMAAIVEGEVAAPSAHRANLPPGFDDIVLRALAKQPGARFQTAYELRAELEALALELELRITSTGIADYMASLFGARAEPWEVDAPTTGFATIDSQGDFDERGPGLVAAPRGAEDRIAKQRGASENEATLIAGGENTGTVTDVDLDDEETRDGKLAHPPAAGGDDDDDDEQTGGDETTVTPPLFEPAELVRLPPPVPLTARAPRLASAGAHGPSLLGERPPLGDDDIDTTLPIPPSAQSTVPVPVPAPYVPPLASPQQPLQLMPAPQPQPPALRDARSHTARVIALVLAFAVPIAIGTASRSCGSAAGATSAHGR